MFLYKHNLRRKRKVIAFLSRRKLIMEYEIRARETFKIDLKELWSFRELIYFFTLRDIKIKYKQTVLGALWAILQPLMLMLVFTLFFGNKFDVTGMPYAVFVFSGLMLWNIFASGISNAGNSMVVNSNIIKKIYFPRLIIPISSIIGTLADFAMTLLMFIVLVFYYHQPMPIFISAINLAMALFITLLSAFGIGSLLAALNVKYRDFRYVIPFMVQILLFLTPVIYPVKTMPDGILGQILLLNPMAGAIEIFRCSFDNSLPSLSLVVKSFGVAIFFFFTGIIFFRRTEYYFADLV